MNATGAAIPGVVAADLPYQRLQPPTDADPLDGMRRAQSDWSALPIKQRLKVLGRTRHSIAVGAHQLAATVPTAVPGYLHRTLADTLVAEVLPLLDACRFLEREAGSVLAPKQGSTRSRPFWLRSVTTVVHRVPFGVVLILAPGNYPLFLPGVQALQALAAGNAVLWKPAHGGTEVAEALQKMLIGAGLDPRLIRILDESVEAGVEALSLGADKVFLTGSATTGQSVMGALTETLTPCVLELSGCDAVFVLDGADIDRAVNAIVFGLRLNGSATCMSPRRLIATGAVIERMLPRLTEKLSRLQPIPVSVSTARKLHELVEDAIEHGATAALDGRSGGHDGGRPGKLLLPTLLDHANPQMLATRSDIFAPLLSILRIADEEEALAAHAQCPYSLTASVFGPVHSAQAFAQRIHAGNVLINDVVVSTADPRAPFGGRGRSGFGTTRGREGLLEMTAVKTIQTQSSRSVRPYQPTTPTHAEFFLGIIHASHGKSLGERWQGLRQIFRAAHRIK